MNRKQITLTLPLLAAVLLTGCGRDRNDHAAATTRQDNSVADDVKERITDAVSDGKQLASNAVEHGRDTASDIIEDGKQAASGLVEDGKEIASEAAEDVRDAVDHDDADGDYRTDPNGRVQSDD